MQTERVVWLEPPQPTDASCLLCGNTQGNQVLLRAAHWHVDFGYLDAALCGHCGSAWFPEATERNVAYPSTDVVLQDPNFIYLIYHYLEIVGGLDWKIGLLERLPFKQFRSVLEIGCNAGVALDYCRTVWGADVVGLEPSAYGIMGSRLLETPILHRYMHEAEEIQGERFDFIFATEVLEHVPQPLGFLQEIRSYLAPNGVALLTTPRAGSLSRATPPGELYAALSAGAHYFLLSPEKLEDLAKQAGFGWCHIEPFGMTNVAVLANQPVSFDNPVVVSARLQDYYQRKCNLSVTDQRTRLGFLLNHYISSRSIGIEVDGDVVQRIADELSGQFEINLDNPDGWLAQVLGADHLVTYGKFIPYSLPFYLYWRALDLESTGKQTHYLELALLLVAKGLATDFLRLFVYHRLLDQIVEAINNNHQQSHLAVQLQVQANQWIAKVPELQSGLQPLMEHNNWLHRSKARLARAVTRFLRLNYD
jgi:SAM-dependent methyltransferase